jgi:hypothetical protein
MRKSTVFISAVLTTFVLVTLYNVASAYRENNKVAEVVTQPTATFAPIATDIPAPEEVVAMTPEEAAHLAAQVVGNSNLLSAESANIDGVEAYKITFTNNDVVYIGLDGQILSVQVAPVVVNVAPPVKQKSNRNDGGNNSEHENRENNEEHEEHND